MLSVFEDVLLKEAVYHCICNFVHEFTSTECELHSCTSSLLFNFEKCGYRSISQASQINPPMHRERVTKNKV